jgi:branched-chain amino acid aminotransferase
MPGSQDFADDPRNASVLVSLNGVLTPRDEAKVSIFDAGFTVGDGVWEGLRLHRGALMFVDAHMDRLFAGAAAIELDIGLSREALIAEIMRTLAANGFDDHAYMRVMITRGPKSGANQDPRNALGIPTVVILAEAKTPSPQLATRGLALATSAIRCSPAEMFDMRLNSHSRLNLIIALQQAIRAGADEALMLDPHGFVSSCNATNLFWVRAGEVRTSTGAYCFQGVTRRVVIECREVGGIPIRPGDFPLDDVLGADEVFVTGTFGGITPVRSVDGRPLAAPLPGPVTGRLIAAYGARKDAEATA